MKKTQWFQETAVSLKTQLVTKVVLALHQSHMSTTECPVVLLHSSKQLSAVISEVSFCQDPLLSSSWTFSHTSCLSKSIIYRWELSTYVKNDEDFRCRHAVSNKRIRAHSISSIHFPFFFSTLFCITPDSSLPCFSCSPY